MKLVLVYRYYKYPSDIQLQEKFWITVTSHLIWPWKPNKTQDIFSKRDSFDPRSKYFVFEDDQLIGYQSFVNGSDMIALGYPWVIDHPKKKEIQNKLWNDTMAVLNEDFKGKYLLQRFREQWTDHIQFFLEKGFQLDEQSPIFIHDVQKRYDFDTKNNITCTIHTGFQAGFLRNILAKKSNYSDEKIRQSIRTADYLDYDFCIYIEGNNGPICYIGLTIRQDADYAEIALLEISDSPYSFEYCHEIAIEQTLLELSKKGISHVSITVDNKDPIIPILTKHNFSIRSKSVYVRMDR